MRKLVILALVGFAAQLVDGGLGMGYGVTSTTMLLVAGLSPAAASASVHLAEIGTNAASGLSHWRLGNVDWTLVARLGLPGSIGAFAGAVILSRLSTEAATPVMAGLLLLLGVYILTRFALRPPAVPKDDAAMAHRRRFLAPLGLVGGFVDATGGGGWGPVSTTTLLTAGKVTPRRVIGSVDTSEFLVTVSASLGFLVGLGTAGIDLGLVGAILAGGLLAAPLAAWLVSRLPGEVLGCAVGGMIVLTNLHTLLEWTGASGATSTWIHVGVVALWATMVTASLRRWRRGRAEVSQPAGALEPDSDRDLALVD